jgi:hypothetical protein
MPLSEVFLTMVVTSGFAFLGGMLAVCYKSKCVRISCCGLVIDRDVTGEEKLDEEELSHRRDVRQDDLSHRNNRPPPMEV